jgi:SAM-dependent methyltransferase
MASGEAELGLIRRDLLADAKGDVLEIGAGTGLNLQYYTDAVASLTLTDPDEPMLRQLRRTVASSGRDAAVLRAPAEDLPFDDETFDTVVCTLVLCGVEDQPRAVRQALRVLKPGGRLLFFEHVRSHDEKAARHQDRMNPLSKLVVLCDCNRPTDETLAASGFVVDELAHGELPKSPAFVRPMIVGRATRPVHATTRQ